MNNRQLDGYRGTERLHAEGLQATRPKPDLGDVLDQTASLLTGSDLM